ncbi:MAG TPA: hypothetical protein VF681_00800 [Abditibacteriaceae bacterium]|jgi:hypothetical protein
MKTNISTSRTVALGTLGVMTLGTTALLSGPVNAGPSTWKKVAIGSAAVTGYGLLKGKGRVATIGGVATAGSYYMYKRSKKKQEAQRRAWYQRRYGRNWRSHYYTKR